MTKFSFFVLDHSRGFWTIFCQISWNSNDWIVRNRQFRATPQALQSTGLDEDKSKNCWVLFVVTFSNIPLCSATLNSVVTGAHCPAGHRYALGKIALFMSTMGAFRFDQNFRKFRFKIEWNRDFPEIRLENFGSPLEVVLFSGNLEIPEIFCSIWHTIQARI